VLWKNQDTLKVEKGVLVLSMSEQVRATVLVKGRVQRVGYRDRVKEIARQMGLAGSVRNIDDYDDVMVTVEGDREKVGQFISEINIHERVINVESIETEFSEYHGEFSTFRIIRGLPDEELGERFDVAVGILYSMDSKLDTLNDKMDTSIGKLDTIIDKVDISNQKLDSLNDKMDVSIGKLDTIIDKVDISNQKLDSLNDKMDVSIGKLDNITGTLEKFRDETNNNFLDLKINQIKGCPTGESTTDIIQR